MNKPIEDWRSNSLNSRATSLFQTSSNARIGGRRPFGKKLAHNENKNFSSLSFWNKLMTNNSETILNILTRSIDKYSDIFKNVLNEDVLNIITKINAKLCKSKCIAEKYRILHITMNKNFLTNWNAIITTTVLEKNNVVSKWKNLECDLSNIITIFEHSLELMPSMCWHMIQDTLKLIKINDALINKNCSGFSDDFNERLSNLNETVVFYERRFNKNVPTAELLEPEDDYRSINIFPSTKELVTPERNFTRKNIVTGSYKNIAHYFDVLFRLMREDFLNPIREDLCNFISNVQKHLFNIHIFKNVIFLTEIIDKDNICFLLQFNMDKKTKNFLSRIQNKSFMTGSLLLFTDNNFRSTFCGMVANSKDLNKGELSVIFENDLPKLKHKYIMVECVVFFDPYYHVLKILQTLPHNEMPMSKYLVDVETTIDRPTYLKLGQISDIDNLNESQKTAMRGALTKEFVIIQGPPGTGKTFLGLIITQELFKYTEGPILIVCYTNHALDQFLSGLLTTTKKIVRLGSQSKNKTLSENYSIRKMRREFNNGDMVNESRIHINKLEKEIFMIDEMIKNVNKPFGIIKYHYIIDNVRFLQESCFSKFTEEDFFIWILQDTSKPNGGLDEIEELHYLYWNYLHTSKEYFYSLLPNDFRKWLVYIEETVFFLQQDIKEIKDAFNENILSEIECNMHLKHYNSQINIFKANKQIITEKVNFLEKQLNREYDGLPYQQVITNPFLLSSSQRWNLYTFWLKSAEESLQEKKQTIIKKYRRNYTDFNFLMEDANVATLKNMDIIGMTTSCAARMHSELQRVRCPVVIVEEAAEVLEAHIVSALTKHCQHLILLGDHQQLKPSTSDYVMEKQFNLGVSLFERMIKNNIQCHTLNVQHRMRPEISSLISPSIYPDLKNHESVYTYPEVEGVKKSLYFIDHNYPEELFGDSSKHNVYEAQYLTKLAEYFLKVGYTFENITILTAYLGQMVTIQKEMDKMNCKNLKKVLVTTVDNFQGEENDIILLSLVRNNNDNNVGFLSIENRICVALSRAKQGLYIMGNMKNLCTISKIWKQINVILMNKDSIGHSLPLVCQNHGTVTNIKELEDFNKVPEGGCTEDCNKILSCGHKCNKKCHILDSFHTKYNCHEKCLKIICTDQLHEPCKKFCFEDCGKCEYKVSVNLSCGHDEQVSCYDSKSLIKIHGHDEQVSCYNSKSFIKIECSTKVEEHLPCGHTIEKICSVSKADIKCIKICEKTLKCGHTCSEICHFDKDPDHENFKCQVLCTKENLKCSKLIKKHTSKVPCSKDANICYVKLWKLRKDCLHHYKDTYCHSDIDNVKCLKPCKKSLPCTHQCPNKCSETCGTCKKEVFVEAPCGHWLNIQCGKYPNCDKQCEKALPCGHICSLKCGDPCSKKCNSICNKELECGHFCVAVCGEPCACEMKAIPLVGLKCTQEPLQKFCKQCSDLSLSGDEISVAISNDEISVPISDDEISVPISDDDDTSNLYLAVDNLNLEN